jgi:hypothetical protein
MARLNLLAEVLAESLTPTRIAGYRAALDDLALADLVVALNECAKHCTFFPKPAEIRARAEAHAAATRRRHILDHPTVPHYLRLEAGDRPASDDAKDTFFAEMRALIKAMPPLTPRGRLARKS